MNKKSKIILAFVLLAYVTCFLLFKYSNSQGILKQSILKGTTIFSFTFHTNLSVIVLLIIAFFCIDKLIQKVKDKSYLLVVVLFLISTFCICLPGHFIVSQADGSEMREYFFTHEIKRVDINDHWISYQISGGYDKKFHYNPEYPCFRYCDGFFARKYQVGKDSYFEVFNGLGPFLNLEDEEGINN